MYGFPHHPSMSSGQLFVCGDQQQGMALPEYRSPLPGQGCLDKYGREHIFDLEQVVDPRSPSMKAWVYLRKYNPAEELVPLSVKDQPHDMNHLFYLIDWNHPEGYRNVLIRPESPIATGSSPFSTGTSGGAEVPVNLQQQMDLQHVGDGCARRRLSSDGGSVEPDAKRKKTEFVPVFSGV